LHQFREAVAADRARLLRLLKKKSRERAQNLPSKLR
jgi:hypothetical protein